MHGAGALRNGQRSGKCPDHRWNKRNRNGATTVGPQYRWTVIGLRKRGGPRQGKMADSHRHAIRIRYSQILARIVSHNVAVVEDHRGRRERQPSSQSRRAGPRQPHRHYAGRERIGQRARARPRCRRRKRDVQRAALPSSETRWTTPGLGKIATDGHAQ